MTKQQIENSLWQSLALDYNCTAGDFSTPTKKVTENILVPGRRMYQPEPAGFSLISNGRSIIINCDPKLREFSEEFLKYSQAEWVSGMKGVLKIERELNKHALTVADMHEFYLPLPGFALPEIPADITVTWYGPEDILQFKDGPWNESYCFSETHPDMLGLSATVNGKLVAMAGASKDWEKLWQIGIDVLPEAEGRGLGALLTALLKDRLLHMGIVPFYGTALSHMASQNVARKAGFYPAWMELYSASVN